ncbi:hypothetical protein GCM10023320_35840 [Pseudonocardia adelaidensis]|uniref:Uncharacterized protein n=1 Tax=Pseudonocardia adelaidensis TaxID=648754 RepID=A0ABP9NJX1_9PSEU
MDLRLSVRGGPVRSRRRETVDEDGEVVGLITLVRRSDFEHVVTSAVTGRAVVTLVSQARPNVAPVGHGRQRSAAAERRNGRLRRRPATRSGHGRPDRTQAVNLND